MVIFLVDKHDNAALIRYASLKTRLIVHSVLASELFSLSAHDLS